MSYQGYVDEQLMASGFKAGYILDHNGYLVASSNDNQIPRAEGAALVQFFQDPESASSNGVTWQGVNYQVTTANPRSIYGENGSDGIVCVRTSGSIIIGVYDQRLKPGNAQTVVEKLGDQFEDLAI